MNVIEVSDLTKRYSRLTAVDGISFSVGEGQVFGFLGPNGSGKTTTIGMLLEIIAPTSGRIRLFEQYDNSQLHLARRRIGATLETPNFYPYLTGRQNLDIVARIKEKDSEAVTRALADVGLTARARDAFSKYSLGMKQRLALAGAMLGDPDLVILDEPANGLDPAGMREIRDIIHGMAAQGKTIFVSSHLLNEVEQTCTHVAIIKKGRVLAQGSMAEVTSGATVALLRAENNVALKTALEGYPAATSVNVERDGVVVTLSDPDLAALNKYLADRAVYLSCLAPRRQSLEDVFMDLTEGANRMNEVAA
jgi:ABC-2 type transport system ATP-binding protein